MPTVAEMIVETLVQVGVKRVYGVAGDSLNSIVDVLRRLIAERPLPWKRMLKRTLGD
jgi:thiamine pyrophosphate-dependent acetolactate synthase large subunit-like protein